MSDQRIENITPFPQFDGLLYVYFDVEPDALVIEPSPFDDGYIVVCGEARYLWHDGLLRDVAYERDINRQPRSRHVCGYFTTVAEAEYAKALYRSYYNHVVKSIKADVDPEKLVVRQMGKGAFSRYYVSKEYGGRYLWKDGLLRPSATIQDHAKNEHLRFQHGWFRTRSGAEDAIKWYRRYWFVAKYSKNYLNNVLGYNLTNNDALPTAVRSVNNETEDYLRQVDRDIEEELNRGKAAHPVFEDQEDQGYSRLLASDNKPVLKCRLSGVELDVEQFDIEWRDRCNETQVKHSLRSYLY